MGLHAHATSLPASSKDAPGCQACSHMLMRATGQADAMLEVVIRVCPGIRRIADRYVRPPDRAGDVHAVRVAEWPIRKSENRGREEPAAASKGPCCPAETELELAELVGW